MSTGLVKAAFDFNLLFEAVRVARAARTARVGARRVRMTESARVSMEKGGRAVPPLPFPWRKVAMRKAWSTTSGSVSQVARSLPSY